MDTNAWPGMGLKVVVWIGAGIACIAGGCGTALQPLRPLAPEAFVRGRPASEGGNPVDRPGQIMYDNYRFASLMPPEENKQGTVTEISPVVRQTVKPPAEETARAATGNGSAPATLPSAPLAAPGTRPADQLSQIVPIGSVLMEVNGHPIFADKVLAELEVPLATEARKWPPAVFSQRARELLERSIQLHARDELEFAAAERALGPDDEAMAKAATMQWRQQQIATAGGSLELAKRKAAADGYVFDELVDRQYRVFITWIYFQKHILPLVQVAASDIRAYYNAHKDETPFTTHGAAQFRVIKIDSSKYFGGPEEAYTRAVMVRKHATDGEDFASVASQYNDDPTLKQTGGYVIPGGWAEEGAYGVADVNSALDKMHPGQISDLIRSNGAYYVVKLEDVRRGERKSFEDLAVQEEIKTKLTAQQVSSLREKRAEKMFTEAYTRKNDPAIDEAFASILRRYPQWANAR